MTKAYATLILAGDTTFSRFPARHPVGIDTGAVIDQLLILASATPMTAAALLQQLGALDTAKVHAQARTLALAGQVDSLILYPVISTSLVFSGVPTDLELVEDSLTKIPLAVSGLTATDSATLKVVSAGTSILASFQCMVHAQDTLRLQAKPNAHGGPFKVGLTLSVGTTNSVTTVVFATVASRNDAPTFGGAPSLLVVSPSVDGSGTLAFTGKSNSSGTAKIRVRAKDDDSTGGNVDTSAWKETTITFDVAPVLTLPLHADSTWEGIMVTAGWAAITDLETSAGNLTLTWTVSDSALLPHDSVYVGTSGSSRNIQFHPVAHKWGACRVSFTLTDSQGVSVTDTIRLTVLPVNHAPTLSMNLPAFVYSYKGAQSLGKIAWDDVDTSQRGHLEVAWTTASDSQFATLSVDSTGKRVMITAKLDTAANLNFKIRARDNAGTTHGGVDTGTWTSVTVQMEDTVLDADGNSYRAKVLGTQTWLTSNLRTAPKIGTTTKPGLGDTTGLTYTWSQAMAVDASCNSTICALSSPQQCLCPDGWHVPDSTEWHGLLVWAGGTGGADSGVNRLRSTREWEDDIRTVSGTGVNLTVIDRCGTDRFGFALRPTTGVVDGMDVYYEAVLWTATQYADNTAGYGIALKSYSTTTEQSSIAKNSLSATLRCMRNSTDRAYYGVSP